jgi:TPR repeat protein
MGPAMRNKVVTAVLLAAVAAGLGHQAQAQTAWVTSYHHSGRIASSRLMLLAHGGDVRAQARLCFMFQAGLGVVQSFAVAATYCRVAAEQGDANAQYLLGLMYDKGQGVGRDLVLSYMWLDLAAAGGSPSVRAAYARIRDAVATKMTPSQLQYGQALATAHAGIH